MQRTRHELVAAWLEKARQDLGRSNRPPHARDLPRDHLSHTQQAAEKALKAYLVSLGVTPPKTHQLEDLVALAAGYDAEVETLSDPAAALTPYAVESRYPEADQVTEEDARHAIKDAEEIRRYVLSRLGQAGWSDGPV